MGYFFQISFAQWLFCFAQNLLTLVIILIYKNFFGSLGYRPCHGPRLSFIPVLKAITHRESWVQRHRNGFESRPARVNLKEDMDEETSAEGKEQQRKALQSFAKEFGRGVRQQQTRGKTNERAGTLPLALSDVQKECVGTWRSRSAE